ncbi:LysR family transcriptional regulator [Vibrio vulnificus]|uniref:LysR family transcriptional regulator n=1 Tax=Vibrio vulnificus TaxID=672 RepID=UPI000CD038F4|nr:LysR family transcriptional regulator [Vibrio vulnificus]EHD1695708.1 LysR family transcriptional regulator [Vibrio vulnificus]EHK9017066.1 LysR family transcriptional regulator [Vibrio vulnificus]EHU4974902.1 LysR family transcriptional regulator [Vibrio vulnificus]EHU4996470.1 LysR family transcriptional regulator [Vibrio vulnificus]EHU9472223.1 LysR family transcriptional regulator [Vibrio vulnificus]
MNKNYRYFLTVAHELNIKQAAEKLHISQPTLTAAIKKLESDIGVSLFHRRSKGVELTEYGRMFKSYAQEQQEKHAQLMHRFTDMQQRHFGKLKVGTGEAWWELFVKQSVESYQERIPNTSLHLEFGNNLSLMHHLVQGELDLFVGHEVQGLHDRCKVHFIPLFQDNEAYFVRREHPLLKIRSKECEKRLEQQKGYPLLRVTPDHARHRSVLADHMTSPFELSASRLEDRAIYDVDSLFASLDLLKCSDAIMPYSDRMCEWMAAREIETLVINRQQLGNVGIYAAKGELDEKTTQFIQLLREHYE